MAQENKENFLKIVEEQKQLEAESSEDEDHLDLSTDADFEAICVGDNNVYVFSLGIFLLLNLIVNILFQ